LRELKRQDSAFRRSVQWRAFDRKTVRKYLLKLDAIPAYRPRPMVASKLDAFRPYLEERLKAGVWNAAVLLRELRAQNYTGGYTDSEGLAAAAARGGGSGGVRRFETPPGRQAQVDWGPLGSLELDSIERQLWGFTFTLGYSRMMMAEGGAEPEAGTLLRCTRKRSGNWAGFPRRFCTTA